MPRNRRAKKVATSIGRLESLENRRMLTGSGVTWDYVSQADAYLTSAEVPAGSGGTVDSVPPGGPTGTTPYTIRALVEYYNETYNGTSPFEIELQSNTTYTLSDTDNASSVWGGRLYNNNEYGALDIDPINTTAPLIIAGGPGTILTCIQVGTPETREAPLDRIFHVIGGSLELQGLTIQGGRALDNGTGTEGTDALGGGVMVNPGGTLGLTSCAIQSNTASGSTGYAGKAGYNAAGGGVYGSAGSVINILGATSFSNNHAYGGKGNTTGITGEPGGDAYGAGLAMAAPVAGPTSQASLDTMLGFTSESGALATFVDNVINAYSTKPGQFVSSGGTGGAGSETGGAGGSASGGGLYLGSGQLNIDGGGSGSIDFTGNQAWGGRGYSSSTTPNLGAGGEAIGAGAYLEPGQVSVIDSTTSGGIFQFSGNTQTSYTGYTPTTSGSTTTYTPIATTTTTGLSLPQVTTATDTGSTSFDGPWNLRTAIAAANPLVATGMPITLDLWGVVDSGFESPSLAYGRFDYYGGTTQDDWTFTGSSGISNNDSGFTGDNPPAPQGSQVAFLQKTGSISQTLTGFASDVDYTISFEAAQRGGYPNQTINVTMDGVSIGTFTPSGTSYQLYTTNIFSPGPGPHLLEFTGVDPSDPVVDQTVFLDNIQIGSASPVITGGLAVSNTGSGTLTIDGGDAGSTIIDASGLNTNVFSFSDAHVILDNLTFEGGSASGNGGGISILNSTVTISNASVCKNTSASAGGSGGGIYQNGGTLALKSDEITGNTAAGSGGGIWLGGGATLTVIGGLIDRNATTGVYGGGVFVSNAKATFNSATVSGNSATVSNGSVGGGLYATAGTIHLNNTQIKHNTAADSGGGVALYSSSSLVISGGHFSSNTSTGGSGGGLYAISNPAVSMNGATIESNAAPASTAQGGGIYQSGGTLKIDNSQLLGNESYQGGGAWFADLTPLVVQSLVKDNSATVNGGGLVSWDDTLDLSDVSVASNKVSDSTSSVGYGGGLYQNSGGALHLLAGTVVKNNSASYGGGILCDSSSFQSDGAKIIENTATVAGGGFCSLANTQTFNFTNGKVSSNQIDAAGAANGGGLYISGGTLKTDGLTVLDNKILAANNQTIQGGGIYASGATITFNGGTAASTTISGNALTGNGAGTAYGAGICLDSGASLAVESVISLTDNVISSTANGVGGAIAFFANTSYTVNYSLTANGNSASAGGDDYAFTVSNTGDSDVSENGPTGINYFTSGTGSLRSAVNYCQTYMTSNYPNNNSMAIMLPTTSSSYLLDLSSSSTGTYQPITTSVASGDTITIIGTNGLATVQGFWARTFYVEGSGSLVLQDLDITGGYSLTSGGGIYQDSGTLTLNGDTVSGNIAGPTGVASPSYKGQTATWNNPGANGGNGASGYGGGIYLAGGTLNLLSNTSITGNTVRGQAGGAGEKGGQGSSSTHYNANAVKSTCDNKNGGAGGDGGQGGDALGGGIYQTGGTLNSPSGVDNISGNAADPGAGGAEGAGGNGASSSGPLCHCNASGGVAGQPGRSGAAMAQYSHAGGGTAFSAGSTSAALAVSGGLYMTSGTLNASSATFAASGALLNPLSGVTVELYSANGSMIATATTDIGGAFRFQTGFSGMGYIELVPIPTFDVVPMGSEIANGIGSTIDPGSMRSAVVEFIDGVPVNEDLDFELKVVPTSFRATADSLAVNRSDTGALLWRDQLMPRSYKGGFDVTRFDFNGDHTKDYVLLTKKGTPRVFFVDGRTGAVTKIRGAVAAGLRKGMVLEGADVAGGGDETLILAPSDDHSGKISVVDLDAKRVLWTSKSTIAGGMTVNLVGSEVPGRGLEADIQIRSVSHPGTVKVFNGQTGAIVRSKTEPSVRLEVRSEQDVRRQTWAAPRQEASFGRKNMPMRRGAPSVKD
jgi:hypothetical protein